MKVQIIIGSTRPGRVSDRVARWVAQEAQKLAETEVEILDLRDFDLPFFDEAISPQYNPDRVPSEVVKKWLDKLAEADAYVLVTPEYNRSYPAVLKNALDYVDFQMARKPVALVAHGSNGGAQAVSHLRGVLPGLLAVTVPKAMLFGDPAANLIDESGKLAKDAGRLEGILGAMLGDLKWYTDALSVARAQEVKD